MDKSSFYFLKIRADEGMTKVTQIVFFGLFIVVFEIWLFNDDGMGFFHWF